MLCLYNSLNHILRQKKCSIIITERNDENLASHLIELFEWLEDMNWSGVFGVLDRLPKYSDMDSIHRAVGICI